MIVSQRPSLPPQQKAEEGHDEDISREEIIRQGIVEEADYLTLENIHEHF